VKKMIQVHRAREGKKKLLRWIRGRGSNATHKLGRKNSLTMSGQPKGSNMIGKGYVTKEPEILGGDLRQEKASG